MAINEEKLNQFLGNCINGFRRDDARRIGRYRRKSRSLQSDG